MGRIMVWCGAVVWYDWCGAVRYDRYGMERYGKAGCDTEWDGMIGYCVACLNVVWHG